MQEKLTKRTIDAAGYERKSGADYRWDTVTTGFGLRVYPSGKKSFVVNYRVRGKQRFMTIGPYGVLTLHQARSKAREILARARLGEDPSGKRLGDLRAPSMKDLSVRYMEEHATAHKKPATAAADRRTWDRIILKKFANRKVKDINHEEVAALHTSLRKTPAMANQMLNIMSKAFNLAETWGWRREGTNPCRRVQRFKSERRERFLSAEELARLSEVLAESERTQSENPNVVAAFRLLILTGCRVGEILNLRWEDVDFERRCLNLPDSKTGPKTVYLNAPALQVLAGIEHLTGNAYVVPGRIEGKPLATLRFKWHRIRKKADLKDVRIHDLRHSFASFGVGLGLPLQPIGKLLGHSQIATTERYAHLADDPIRQANEKIGDHIWAVMSGKPKAEAVAGERGGAQGRRVQSRE